MGSWIELPVDLLHLIGERIHDHKDFLHFGAVCVRWRCIMLANCQHLPYGLPLSYCLHPQRPLPLLMQFNYENNIGMISFLSISNRKINDGFIIPEMNHKWISGSSEGWLVTVDTHGWQIHLLNPLTKAQITLPPLSVFKHPKGSFKDEFQDFGFLNKAIIFPHSKRTSFGKGCVVIGIVSCITVLSLCRPGDDTWTNIKGSPIHIDDVIPYKGQAYVVIDNGTVVACDLIHDLKFIIIAGQAPAFGEHNQGKSRIPTRDSVRRYLVESTCGDLLQVVRIEEDSNVTDRFVVYRLEANPIEYEEPIFCYRNVDGEWFKQLEFMYEWVELDSLGDQMLFLGHNCSLALSAVSYSGCKGNCIYFADDSDRHRVLARETVYGNPQEFRYEEMEEEEREIVRQCIGSYHIGIFDMETKSVFPCEEMKGKCFPIPPVWIVPNPW